MTLYKPARSARSLPPIPRSRSLPFLPPIPRSLRSLAASLYDRSSIRL